MRARIYVGEEINEKCRVQNAERKSAECRVQNEFGIRRIKYGRGGVAVKGDMVYRLSEHMVYKYRYSLTA